MGKKKKKVTRRKNLWEPRKISPLLYIYQKSASGMGKDAILDLDSSGFRSGYWFNTRAVFPS